MPLGRFYPYTCGIKQNLKVAMFDSCGPSPQQLDTPNSCRCTGSDSRGHNGTGPTSRWHPKMLMKNYLVHIPLQSRSQSWGPHFIIFYRELSHQGSGNYLQPIWVNERMFHQHEVLTCPFTVNFKSSKAWSSENLVVHPVDFCCFFFDGWGSCVGYNPEKRVPGRPWTTFFLKDGNSSEVQLLKRSSHKLFHEGIGAVQSQLKREISCALAM